MPEFVERITDFILRNITLVIFLVFALSGLFGRSGKKKPAPGETTARPASGSKPPAGAPDNRPLAERLADYFGVDLEEMQGKPAQQPPAAPGKYASQGRRSTTTGNVQDQYPELFGGASLFEDRKYDGFDREGTKWGFDDAEWGSTFEKNEQQWGGAFSDRKNSEPRIEWPD